MRARVVTYGWLDAARPPVVTPAEFLSSLTG